MWAFLQIVQGGMPRTSMPESFDKHPISRSCISPTSTSSQQVRLRWPILPRSTSPPSRQRMIWTFFKGRWTTWTRLGRCEDSNRLVERSLSTMPMSLRGESLAFSTSGTLPPSSPSMSKVRSRWYDNHRPHIHQTIPGLLTRNPRSRSTSLFQRR